MTRWSVIVFLGLALAAAAAAQAPAAPLLSAGTVIQAVTVTDFDTANSQVGDQVSVTTAEEVKQGKFKLPKHSTLHGHVMKISTAASSQDDASIALLFDSATTPKGQTYPLHAVVASITIKPPAAARPAFGGNGGGYGRRRGGMGGYPSSPRAGGGGDASAPAAAQRIEVRIPADAAASGSLLVCQQGNFFIYPQTKLTLQVVAAASQQ